MEESKKKYPNLSILREEVAVRDYFVGGLVGEGAIPLKGRETRQEPCTGCRIDPDKPFEAGNAMVTTKEAIGTLSQQEVRDWCSELKEVGDGRCARARAIRQVAAECKSKFPNFGTGYFQCFIPAFSAATRR